MKAEGTSKKSVGLIRKLMSVVSRLLLFLGILGTLAFVYLRMYGVPAPLVSKVLERIGESGYTLTVERVFLSLFGWRAEEVCLYSSHPDDLEPLLQADFVRFSMRTVRESDGSVPPFTRIDVEIPGARLVPPIALGRPVPEASPLRDIGKLQAEIDLYPDRVTIHHGVVEWIGCRFAIRGDILKRTTEPAAKKPASDFMLLSQVPESVFTQVSNQFNRLSFPDGLAVAIDFEINSDEVAASHVEFSVTALQPIVDPIQFSKFDVMGRYADSILQIDRAFLQLDGQALELKGAYNFTNTETRVTLSNAMTSKQLLKLLPETLLEPFESIELGFNELPRFELTAGPVPFRELIEGITGSVSLPYAAWRGLEVDGIRSDISIQGPLLKLSKLQGMLRSQPDRSAISTMRGGPCSGDAFWDADTLTFGFSGKGEFDPHLLDGPLSMFEYAIEIIDYFSFKDAPPRANLMLGSTVGLKDSFYLEIQALVQDASFRDVEFTSANVTAKYYGNTLTLDPIVVFQKSDFAKGSLTLDFEKEILQFDMQSSLPPAVIEKIALTNSFIFSEEVLLAGHVQLVGRGQVDWGTMETTAFSGTVEAERLSLPVGEFEEVSAAVHGKGPWIYVEDAQGTIYDGEASGRFQVRIDPNDSLFPYRLDAICSEVSLKSVAQFFSEKEMNVAGTLTGEIRLDADFSTNFFAAAQGNGHVLVDEGQLMDLPLFKTFSKTIRMVIPRFQIFSITSLEGDFEIKNGLVASDEVQFKGNIISAMGRGKYRPEKGFDAKVRVNILSDDWLSKIVRVVTDPLMRIFDLELKGTLSDPTWRLNNLP